MEKTKFSSRATKIYENKSHRNEILCASRNPTSPSRTRRQQNGLKEQVFQEESYAQIVARSFQNKAQNFPKSSPKNLPQSIPRASQIEPKWRQEGARTAKKTKKNIDPTRRGVHQELVPHTLRRKWPTWRQVGFPNRAKINKKSMPTSIKQMMPSKIDF